MRSSKSRSRNKNNNRNRSGGGGGGGNVMNRVFDSNGPEGKVRGTPQQIIEKYGQLARDAALANDRVAAESFQQHAEHYTRMLASAQVEIDARREVQEREHRERQQVRNEQQQSHQQQQGGQQQQPQQHDGQQPQQPPAEVQPIPAVATDLSQTDQPEMAAPVSDGDSGLVDTPEAAPVKRRAPRARKPKVAPKVDDKSNDAGDTQPDEPKAAE